MDNSIYFIEQEKVMNLVEKLISEVEKRPLLWNRFDNDYSNRSAVDAEWEKIAEILSKDKNYVKHKWRNLRDQFIREIKKVKVPFDNPTKPYIEYYRGKWAYFEHMLFLKLVSTPSKKTAGYSSTDELHEDDIKVEIIDYEDDIFPDSINYNSAPEITKVAETMASKVEESLDGNATQLEKETSVEEETGRKRKALETTENVAKVQRLSVATAPSISVESREDSEIDDDLHFFKSLIPFLKKLSPIRKLLVRNEIQTLLIRESLCETCKAGNHSTHNT